ncbi:hypothetical protein M404DRAFT_1008522 [Pisolithus tinctorius Marx 270]|uniref:Uncharacterized protein n=1 Tax=Pisolithus tinctorius Marx 270 TaxID=870435 RepID=A0A0C3IAW2_PISTI|nr:hypothetical protein M404DRAFT_1008522 [Pisolithus tinctorius Marx 270]
MASLRHVASGYDARRSLNSFRTLGRPQESSGEGGQHLQQGFSAFSQVVRGDFSETLLGRSVWSKVVGAACQIRAQELPRVNQTEELPTLLLKI